MHFIHVKPPHLSPGQKVYPILMVHGWPGSFYEFYHILPLLTEPGSHGLDPDMAFEVICPSIPGYGFSEASSKTGEYRTPQGNDVGGPDQDLGGFRPRWGVSPALVDCFWCYLINPLFFSYLGFNAFAAARIFYKLMLRLGFNEFYLQGGDWGSRITCLLSQMKPE